MQTNIRKIVLDCILYFLLWNDAADFGGKVLTNDPGLDSTPFVNWRSSFVGASFKIR